MARLLRRGAVPPFYASVVGRPSLAPGRYFRLSNSAGLTPSTRSRRPSLRGTVLRQGCPVSVYAVRDPLADARTAGILWASVRFWCGASGMEHRPSSIVSSARLRGCHPRRAPTDVLGHGDELTDGTGGSVDAVTGTATGPYQKSQLNEAEVLHGLRHQGRRPDRRRHHPDP